MSGLLLTLKSFWFAMMTMQRFCPQKTWFAQHHQDLNCNLHLEVCPPFNQLLLPACSSGSAQTMVVASWTCSTASTLLCVCVYKNTYEYVYIYILCILHIYIYIYFFVEQKKKNHGRAHTSCNSESWAPAYGRMTGALGQSHRVKSNEGASFESRWQAP